jgi:hypothetical protein
MYMFPHESKFNPDPPNASSKFFSIKKNRISLYIFNKHYRDPYSLVKMKNTNLSILTLLKRLVENIIYNFGQKHLTLTFHLQTKAQQIACMWLWCLLPAKYFEQYDGLFISKRSYWSCSFWRGMLITPPGSSLAHMHVQWEAIMP